MSAFPSDLKLSVESALSPGPGSALDVLCTITPPPGRRVPVDLIAVVDTSGSMQVDAALRDDSGRETETGFTNLCIVKHALRTVLHMLNPQDQFSLVTYSSTVRHSFLALFMTRYSASL